MRLPEVFDALIAVGRAVPQGKFDGVQGLPGLFRQLGASERSLAISGPETSVDQEFDRLKQLAHVWHLGGSFSLDGPHCDAESLSAGDSFVLPAGEPYTFSECSEDLQILEVALPVDLDSGRRLDSL